MMQPSHWISRRTLMAWFRKFHVLSHDTADSCVMGCYYLAVVQAKLLFGSETWVLSPCLTWWLESFHNRCAPAIALCPIQCHADGTWEYPPMDEVLAACALSLISTYIARCKTRLLNHYANAESQLYNKCVASTPVRSGALCQMWWAKNPNTT
jgi:hypothetical protein